VKFIVNVTVLPEVSVCVEEGVIEERVAFVGPEEIY